MYYSYNSVFIVSNKMTCGKFSKNLDWDKTKYERDNSELNTSFRQGFSDEI